jgi:hypothetical protein
MIFNCSRLNQTPIKTAQQKKINVKDKKHEKIIGYSQQQTQTAQPPPPLSARSVPAPPPSTAAVKFFPPVIAATVAQQLEQRQRQQPLITRQFFIQPPVSPVNHPFAPPQQRLPLPPPPLMFMRPPRPMGFRPLQLQQQQHPLSQQVSSLFLNKN